MEWRFTRDRQCGSRRYYFGRLPSMTGLVFIAVSFKLYYTIFEVIDSGSLILPFVSFDITIQQQQQNQQQRALDVSILNPLVTEDDKEVSSAENNTNDGRGQQGKTVIHGEKKSFVIPTKITTNNNNKHDNKINNNNNTIIRPNFPLEFVHIPKTGGSAIEYVAAKAGIIWGLYHWQKCPINVVGNKICNNGDWKRIHNISYKDLTQVVDKSWEMWHTPPSWFPYQRSPYRNKKLFAVIRNPYERFISEYYCPYMGLNPKYKTNNKNASSSNNQEIKPTTPETLNAFIMNRLSYRVTWTGHYVPQADFIYNKAGKQIIRHVLRYENLTAGFTDLMQQYQLPITLNETMNEGRLLVDNNSNRHNKRRMTFDDLYPETINRINTVAAKDFNLLGYNMRHPYNRRPYKSSNSILHNPKSIAFLFILKNELTQQQKFNEELWEKWFPPITDKRYSIFVYPGRIQVLNQTNNSDTNFSTAPNTNIRLGSFFCRYAIPHIVSNSTVKEQWMYNGMMRILRTAFDEDMNAQGFIFLNPTILPLLSFDQLYQSIINNEQDERQSRLCFADNEEAKRVWNNVAAPNGLNWQDVKKIDIWSSVIRRSHVKILLQNQPTMERWYKIFYKKRYQENLVVGSPDECFFPTILSMKLPDTEFQVCSPKTSTREELMNNDYNTSYPKSCCITRTFWNNNNSPVFVGSSMTKEDILLSDNCNNGTPCFMTSVYEEGLVELQNQGFWFLRNVALNAILISTIEGNETVYLNDALPQLHAKQPIKPLQSTNTLRKLSNQQGGFQCSAPVS